MSPSELVRRISPFLLGAVVAAGCHRKQVPAPISRPAAPPPAKPARPPIPTRAPLAALADGQTYAYERGVAKATPVEAARAAGLLDVDLGDDWAPFILQDGAGADAKPNAYRETFVGLANDRLAAEGEASRAGDNNYLEAFGIPPTLSVLAARVEVDAAPAREACTDAVDRQGLAEFTGEVGYLDRDRSKRDHEQALRDADWMDKELAERTQAGVTAEAALAALREDPKARGRVDRAGRGRARVRAVRAAQARLLCEGLLSPRSRYTPGMYDLPTHEALATWERKNDVFGWGFLGGETLGMLLAPSRSLLLDTFKRVLAERVADAAGIVEDGSINLARKRNPPTWHDADGAEHPVPNLIEDHVNALLAAVGVATPEDAIAFLRAHKDGLAKLHVAFKAPSLPAYYQPEDGAKEMNVSVEIDRGDIWYDVPFDARGKPIVQRRDHFPHLTLFVRWHGQKIPLCWWRTTIGSWRSEMHADGHVYMKYKNSDVGPRIWKTIVATPVWIPPDGTPAKDLLTRKVLDRNVGPITVVNTDVMGPGYQSAYGLVMGIHIDPARGGFDNQIRTHGSVDYTSIARRFSHGCHRLVNNRAVRLYDFVLRHRAFERIGDVPMNLKKRFEVDGEPYRYTIKTRGYYYELASPVPVNVLEGRVMGEVKKPITAYVRKPGVDYSEPASGDATASTAVASPGASAPEARSLTAAGAAVVAAALLVAGPALAAKPGVSESASTELDVTLDPGAGRIAGHARLRIVNDDRRATDAVNLWLYPNALATRSQALTDVSFHWLYPGGFSPAGIDIRNVRVEGAPVTATLVDTPQGPATIAQMPLPTPLASGGTVTIDVDFETRIPRRYGAFGCDGVRCRLMGGFYPTPSRRSGRRLELPPDEPPVARAGRTRVTLRLPPGLALVLDGQPIAHPDAAPITVESADLAAPTIVTDRVLRPASAIVGGHLVRFLHRKPRPPSSDDRPLPYTREDIPGLVLETARRALRFADLFLGRLDALPPPVRDLPLTLVEAPLRHELVQVHGDVILVSDQIFRIFPVERLRKYHRLEIARAVFAALVEARIAATEAPVDRERATGVLAAYLTDLYTLSEFDKLEYATDILRPFDFVPAVDQLIYAPRLASPSTYFGDVEDTDRVKDGPRRFADAGPGPRFVYNKLLDLLGPSRFPVLARAMLAAAVPLRPAASEAFGAELDWFWSEWLGGWPRVNYRLDAVTVTPRGGGSHVVIDIRREGDRVREPVEVLVEDRAGGKQTLRWDDGAEAHRFEVDLPAGLAAVEVDPRHRLVETAVGSLRPSDDPLRDNRRPARWRFIYEGAGALLNISQLTASFAAAFLLRPQHDLRRELLAAVFHDEANQIGVQATYGWNFGRQVDKDDLSSQIYAGADGARLDPSFGQAVTARPQPGWRASGRLGFRHNTRDYLFDPWRAVGLGLAVGYALTALDQGDRLSQLTAGAEALRLFELAPGHVLAVDASGEATFGDIRLPSQLTGAGGLSGLRGFFADELLARANVIGHLQLRDDYVTGLDWNLLHFTTVRGIAGTVFADAAAITSCAGYAFSRDRVYADVGYSFRVLHDAFGVYQQLLSIDFAVPLHRNAAADACGAPRSHPPFTVLISFFPSF